MLSHLYIENYVLIDKIDIDFSKGLSVISGETGSGKSILLGALGLILGQRADTQVLLDKNKKCIIEGHFNIKNYNLSDFYNNNELDYEENTILRREINNKGKSRAFINDTPVTLNLMKELGERLVDIHSQHKTLEINESDFQLAVIDEYANNKSLLKEYRINLAAYKKLILQYKELEEKTRQAKIESDYWQFLFNELDNAEIKEGEQEELEKELEIQNNAELIKKQLFEATNYLTESENNIEGTLSIIINNLNKLGNSLTSVQDFKQRIESARIELSDISKEMGIINDKINYNPERINHISENLDYIYHLQNKHNVKTISELIEIKNQLSDKLNNIISFEKELFDLKSKIEVKKKYLDDKSDILSANRVSAIPHIEKQLKQFLTKLGIPGAEIKIITTTNTEFNNSGKDEVVYYFNANKGNDSREISKVASGGELSRIMLAVKALLSEKNQLPTIVFDEIDIGVSGEIALKTASIIHKMSERMQVIVISHLPQIVAKGDIHYLVYKDINDNITHSKIRKLNKEERIEEIAKIIGGDKITSATIETAKELLKQ